MSKLSCSQVTAALTFKVPQKVGWSVQCGNQSWAGNELGSLVDCLAQKGNKPKAVSLSLIFELSGNDGTERYGRRLIPPSTTLIACARSPFRGERRN